MSGASTFFRTHILLLGVLVLASCASKEKKLKATQADLYFNAGTQSLMDQQYTDALKALLKANELQPKNSLIINNLAMAYYFKGEKEIAIKNLNYALKLDEDNSDAKVNLASIYLKDGKVNEAEELYKTVLKDLTYDKQARTYYNLGIIEFQYRKDSVAAENYFKNSIKEDDNYCPAYYQLGMVQYNRRQFNSSLKNFKEATLGVCVDNPAPHYQQALSLIQLRRFDEARLKLDDIESRFKKTSWADKARQKAIEITEIESRHRLEENHARRNVHETPEF